MTAASSLVVTRTWRWRRVLAVDHVAKWGTMRSVLVAPSAPSEINARSGESAVIFCTDSERNGKMSQKTITVRFSCDGCGLRDVAVVVPARLSPQEDLEHYMKQILPGKISEAHTRMSPRCMARKIANVKIPLSDEATGGEGWIGQVTDRVPPRDKPKPKGEEDA